MFYHPKAMLLRFKIYVFRKSKLFFVQIKESFLYLEKVICNEKRKPKMFSNVKKLTICKQFKGERVKK